MGLEHIWAGWRSTYVASVTPEVSPDGSVFTQLLHSGLSDDAANVVHRGATCFAVLNAYPYGTGHTLVVPYREVSELEDLEPREFVDLWSTVTDAVRAIKKAYAPEGLNVGINLGRPAGGSVAQHLHVHVVPRWTGDANFLTAVANTRALPEALDITAARIRAAWPVARSV